jgi:hypothetical protein
VVGVGHTGIGVDQLLGSAAGFFHGFGVVNRVGDAKRRQAVLPRPQQLARAAQRKVDLGQAEAVGRGNA